MQKQKKINLALSAVLLLIYITAALVQLFVTKRYNPVAILESIGTIILLAALFSSADAIYYFSAALFAMFAQFFGAMLFLYDKIPCYDIIMHLLSGIIIAFVAQYIFTLCLTKIKSYNVPVFCGIAFSLFVGLSYTALWEIFEFTVDNLFGLDCQLGSLTDTMTDIIAGCIGALAGSGIVALITIKKNGKSYVKPADEKPHKL